MKNKNIFRLSGLVLFSIFSLTVSCSNGGNDDSAQPAQPMEPEFQLAWIEDFSGSELNLTDWSHRLQGTWRSAYNDPTALSVAKS